MKFLFKELKEFNVATEKKRINKCFSGRLHNKLHKIVDLFCDEKFQECLDSINSLGYDKKVECDEKEYISIFISDAMFELCYKEGFKIEKVKD